MAKQIQLTCVIKKEGKLYSSVCPELNVASYGRTPAEAKRKLKEAVESHLQVAKEENMLDEILEEQELRKKSRIVKLSIALPAD